MQTRRLCPFSLQTTFPVQGGPSLILRGVEDAVVAKENAAGKALDYNGYIGGSGNDQGLGIAVDGAGNVYVAGYTDSDETTFPVLDGPQLTYNGGFYDGFVAKVTDIFVPSAFIYLPLVRR